MQLPGLESEPTPPPPEPITQQYDLYGQPAGGSETVLETDIIAWSWDGGVWWMTGDDGITGYNMARYDWLSLTPGEPVF